MSYKCALCGLIHNVGESCDDACKRVFNPLPNSSDEQGRKDDLGKLRYDLLPVEPVREVVKVLTYGAMKYSPGNWKAVPDAKARYTAALMRHFEAWRGGETLDPESHLPHLAHAICCALFLLWFELTDKQ